jgi:hypothetical protein
MIKFLLLVSRQGKVRLSKWYDAFNARDRARITREATALVLARGPKLCNIVEYKEHKVRAERGHGSTGSGGEVRGRRAARRASASAAGARRARARGDGAQRAHLLIRFSAICGRRQRERGTVATAR